MSEVLNTVEIEDVLSSIRRLVSDDIRPASRDVAQVTGNHEANKLLLTPALRAVRAKPEVQEGQSRGIDEVVAVLSAGVVQQDAEWEPETGDLSMPAVVVEAEIWEDVPVIEDYAAPLDFVSARRVADPEAEVAAEAQATAEAQAEDESAPLAEVGSLPGWAQSAGAEESDAARPDPVVGDRAEPDATWADAAEAAVLQELQGAAAPEADYGPDAFALNEDEGMDSPVDEAMLREIVRDVLREELQGRLGERITRNIRKLVRAEIARVFASEDLI